MSTLEPSASMGSPQACANCRINFHDLVLDEDGRSYCRLCRILPKDSITAFLSSVYNEILRARSKFPANECLVVALGEEYGELCKAVLDESQARVRAEAVQVACVAARIVLDGDNSIEPVRAVHGLDRLK